MRQLYYLAGLSGTGKSSALRLLYEQLTGITVDDGDIDEIIQYGDVSIALFSRGDWLPKIQNRLLELLRSDVRVLVCVSRERGQVNNFLRWKAPEFGFTVERLERVKAADRSLIHYENTQCASLLYDKLNGWLDAQSGLSPGAG